MTDKIGLSRSDDVILIDNSRVKAYKACAMNYFINHQLYWRPAIDAPALGFGGCWHEAMAMIFNMIKKHGASHFSRKELIVLAKHAFMEEWKKREMPNPDNMLVMEDYFPRVPGVAFSMIENYVDQKYNWFQEIEVLAVEQPFLVPLTEYKGKRVFLIGRTDLDFKDREGIWVGEHKTSSLYSKTYTFQYKFTHSFSNDAQVNTYVFKQKMTYGAKVKGAQIFGALMHAKIHDKFKVIPIYKDDFFLEAWYKDTCYWVHQLIDQTEQDFWPKNDTSCATQYGFCQNKAVCDMVSDPRSLATHPMGYKIEKWEPYDETTMKKIMKEMDI